MAEGAGPSLARGASRESLDTLTTRRTGRRPCRERKVAVMVSSPHAAADVLPWLDLAPPSPQQPPCSQREVPPPHSRTREPADLAPPAAAFPAQPAGEGHGFI